MIKSIPTRVIIHVGLPKCASSSIQSYFADNYWKNIRQGVFYPHDGRLERGYRSHLPLFSNFEKLDERIDSIQRKARLFRSRYIVLSTEALIDRIPSGTHSKCLLHILERFGRENVDIVAISRAPGGLITSSYHQFLMAGLWEVDRIKFFKSEKTDIHAYLEAFRELWGFNLQDYDKLFPLFAEQYGVQTITEFPLIANGIDALTMLCDKLEIKKNGELPKKNAGRTIDKVRMFRNFQEEYGVREFDRNLRALRSVNFKERQMTEEMAVEQGFTLPHEIYNDLDTPYLDRAEIREHKF